MLASVMPTSMAPPSQFSRYSLGSTGEDNKIPGLDTPADENPPTISTLPFLGNINVNDLFAKLVASGIVTTPSTEVKKPEPEQPAVDQPPHEAHHVTKEDKNTIKPVDLLKPETLRV